MAPRLSDEKSPSIEKDSPVLSTKDLEASEPIVRYANPLDDPQFASIDEKKLLRKIDMRLIPWLSFLYLLSFLDRSAIGEWLSAFDDDTNMLLTLSRARSNFKSKGISLMKLRES